MTKVNAFNARSLIEQAIKNKSKFFLYQKKSNGWQSMKIDPIFEIGEKIKFDKTTHVCGNGSINGSVFASFRLNHKKNVFQTVLEGNSIHYPTSDIYIFPQRLFKKHQIKSGVISVKFWEESNPHDVHYGQVIDISASAIKILTPFECQDDYYVCVINSDPVIVNDAVYKRKELKNGRFETVFQLFGTETDIDKMKKINQVLNKLNKLNRKIKKF